MLERKQLMGWLKGFSILWSIFSVSVVIVCNAIVINNWPVDRLPINVKNSFQVALLLAPGALAALIYMFFEKK